MNKRVSRRAPNNSSRDIVSSLIGATLAFDMTKLVFTVLFVEHLRYITAAYADFDASQNPINSSLGLELGFTHLGIVNILSFLRSAVQLVHSFIISPGINSFQGKSNLQRQHLNRDHVW